MVEKLSVAEAAADPAHSLPNPTEAMVARCSAWCKVVKNLLEYFQQQLENSASITGQQEALVSVLKAPHSEQFMAEGKGGISDVAGALSKFHRDQAVYADRLQEVLSQSFIPRLDRLHSGLHKSMADFRGLSDSFNGNTEGGRSSSTGQGRHAPDDTSKATEDAKALQQQEEAYAKAIEAVQKGESPKVDPYVLKLGIEQRLATQIAHVNRVADAHAYAKDAIHSVDGSVTKELQSVLAEYADAINSYAETYGNTANALATGFVSRGALDELHAWIKGPLGPPSFAPGVSLARLTRADESYKYENSPFAQAIRRGRLDRRTKFLRSFTGSDYVLTPSSLIELKQGVPELGLDLTDAELIPDHKHTSANQFVLSARQAGSASGRMHTWVFRSSEAADWTRDLQELLGAKTPAERAAKLAPKPVIGVAGLSLNESSGPTASKSANAADAPVSTPTSKTNVPAVQAHKDLDQKAATVTAASTASLYSDHAVEDSASDVSIVPHEHAYSAHVTPLSEEPHGTGPWPAFGTENTSSTEGADESPRASSVSTKPRASFGTGQSSTAKAPAASLAWQANRDLQAFKASALSGVPGADSEVAADDASTWSYDLTHDPGTFKSDKNFHPVDSHLSPHVERRLTQTSHKLERPDIGGGIGVARTDDEVNEPHERVLERRRSSLSVRSQSGDRRPRRATGSYGGELEALKPLSSTTPDSKSDLFFADGLPKTTSGAAN